MHIAPPPRTSWTPARLAAAWLLPKIAMMGLWALISPGVQGDVFYYWQGIHDLAARGPQHTMIEYPTPMLWLLHLPYVLGFGTRTGFLIAFIALLMAVDAAFALVLYRRWERHRATRHPWPVLWWLGFTFLLGPTAYLRFDLLPAVLAGGALLLVAERRPGWAGCLIGLGAALKLWPALLWLTLLGRRHDRRPATVGVFGFGGLLALVSLAYAGWDRLISPLHWQSDRGLQVESVWASVPMLQRLFAPDAFTVEMSAFNAFEIWGPGVDGWLAAASGATAAGLVLIVALMAWTWWRGTASARTIAGLAMIAITLVMIVTNKTFSPQYVMWLGGPMAALLALGPAHSPGPRRRTWRTLSLVIIAITFATQLVYPIGYDQILWGGPFQGVLTVVLAARNIAVVLLTGWLAWLLAARHRPADVESR